MFHKKSGAVKSHVFAPLDRIAALDRGNGIRRHRLDGSNAVTVSKNLSPF